MSRCVEYVSQRLERILKCDRCVPRSSKSVSDRLECVPRRVNCISLRLESLSQRLKRMSQRLRSVCWDFECVYRRSIGNSGGKRAREPSQLPLGALLSGPRGAVFNRNRLV